MDTIIIIVDQFMKMIRLKAMTTSISSEGIAKIYRDNIWKLHGVPRFSATEGHNLHQNSWENL